MRHKRIIARVLTLATALAIAVGTTCVTALAYDTRIETLILNGQPDSEDILHIILSKENQDKLKAVVCEDVPLTNNSTVRVEVDAKRLDSKSVTLPTAVTAAEPLLVGKLTLTTQVDSGSKVVVSRVNQPVQLTIMLPTELDGGSYHLVSLDGSSYTVAADLDTVPNTVTFVVTAVDKFVVTRGAVEAPKPAAATPIAPTEPKSTTATTNPNPTAGGVMDSLVPRTVLAQAVPISMPTIPLGPAQSGFSSSMAATSMMMTAAFVSGTIDYENSQQQEPEPDEEPDSEDDAVLQSFDEDDEDGIEEELEGFREVRYH